MSFAEQLVNKINEFRANPKGYAKKINEYVPCFKGKTLRIPNTNKGIRTEEGASAYIEAAEFLSKQEGVEPLQPSKGLARICAEFMSQVQNLDPNELGNINLEEIIEKYGAFEGDLNRQMEFGGEDPEQVLINLIVCDGDPNRGNRESLLSTSLKKIGVASGKHPIYRFATIIVSCTKFNNTYDPNDEGFLEEEETKETSTPAKEDVKETPEPKEKNYEETPKPIKKVVKETPTSSAPPKEIIKETDEGKTIKPRKVILKEKPKEEKPTQIEDEDEDIEIPPEDVISEKKTEKIYIENGKKKKIIKICRTMKDGTKETETIKESVEDDE